MTSNIGRPKAEFNLSESDIKHILSEYADGCSDAEIKAYIHGVRGSFSNDLWERWIKEEPVFSEAVKEGRLLSNAWWEKAGRVSLRDKEFSYTGWYMNMKNRFGWRDKMEQENTGDITLNINKTVHSARDND